MVPLAKGGPSTGESPSEAVSNAIAVKLLAVIGLAGQTNHLVTAMQIPVDPEFEVGLR